jgi:hypothetical protein
MKTSLTFALPSVRPELVKGLIPNTLSVRPEVVEGSAPAHQKASKGSARTVLMQPFDKLRANGVNLSVEKTIVNPH